MQADFYICGNFLNIKSLILCARQLRMDILTCALTNHIILNNINKSKSWNHCQISNELINPTATPITSSVSIRTQVRDCKVVLEEISLTCGAAKLQMLDLIRTKPTQLIHITQRKVIS